ncbi:MAG TPA: amidohydrolase [Deltaproteobacteria bacterium]|jgi:amidohydrolase|nr:amidohydrolase [Deltaproteobacteria bacterium]
MTSPNFDPESAQILTAVDEAFAEACTLAHWMAVHPELALEEREASARYVAWLEARGFAVERGVAGMETAFLARRGFVRAPLHAVLLAEMDALPGIGHACGHNLSGPASLLAAHALAASLPEEALQLVVAGAPAEEIGVGKRRLVEAGVFRDAHVAMMAHASDMRRAHRLFLGNHKFEFVYHGRASHAAAYPEQGLNALDGVIQLFVAIGALRQQLPRTARIHGIVSDGGRAPNIIPERAAARVWVRALDDVTLETTTVRVVACARGAAEATGTRLEVLRPEAESPAMRPNLALAGVYRRQLERLGFAETSHAADASIGSSDITHVSQVVPTIHPNFPIVRAGERLELHTRAFAEATIGPEGEAGLREAARSLALTVRELARSPSLRAEVAEEHQRSR